MILEIFRGGGETDWVGKEWAGIFFPRGKNGPAHSFPREKLTGGKFRPVTPVRSHTFMEIDHEMISTVILLLPLIHSRRVVVSYKRKYVHELLVNRLFKPAQEKVWLGELTVPQWP